MCAAQLSVCAAECLPLRDTVAASALLRYALVWMHCGSHALEWMFGVAMYGVAM